MSGKIQQQKNEKMVEENARKKCLKNPDNNGDKKISQKSQIFFNVRKKSTKIAEKKSGKIQQKISI